MISLEPVLDPHLNLPQGDVDEQGFTPRVTRKNDFRQGKVVSTESYPDKSTEGSRRTRPLHLSGVGWSG